MTHLSENDAAFSTAGVFIYGFGLIGFNQFVGGGGGSTLAGSQVRVVEEQGGAVFDSVLPPVLAFLLSRGFR